MFRFLAAAGLTIVVVAFVPIYYMSAQYRRTPSEKEGANPVTGKSSEKLVSGTWEERLEAAETLRSERRQLEARLVALVEHDTTVGLGSSRSVAAKLLGEFQFVSAVPTLAAHVGYEVPIAVDDLREFYMEAYPCAHAIAMMGPSAMKPTLKALATRAQPLSQKECRVAAYLIVALCDESKEEAIEAIVKAEEKYKDSKNLRPIRMQIEHFMDFHKNVKNRHSPPSA